MTLETEERLTDSAKPRMKSVEHEEGSNSVGFSSLTCRSCSLYKTVACPKEVVFPDTPAPYCHSPYDSDRI